MANALRALAMDAVEKAKSGHPGMPMGMADVATVLWTKFLKFDPAAPHWPDRDRFVLSAGHGSMLLYGLLHLTGFADMTMEEIRKFRQLGSKTAGHPEYGHATGIETTTGPLGQGLANAVGMAIAERWLNARFGDAVVDHFTYVIAGDGCLMEGISQEAISLAGHLRLNRLVVLFDDNGISIDGPTSLTTSDDQCARFAASGWNAVRIDGHDPQAIEAAIAAARKSDRPTLIACRTTIGYGAPTKAGTAGSHGSPLGAAEIESTRQRLGWTNGPFEIPVDVLERWLQAGHRGATARKLWEGRIARMPAEQRAEFKRIQAGKLPKDVDGAIAAYKAKLLAEKPNVATRVASQNALDVLAAAVPELIGGSADLTGSNNTKAKSQSGLSATDYGGRYVYWGVREHAMAAAMNGMGLRVVFVMTHDSIGLGEDGPTHQPVEHLAALRAIPNLAVFRPADAVETLECWQIALERRDGPSVLALTRQNLATLRSDPAPGANACARGGYVLAEAAGGERQVTLIGTGSETSIALAAQKLLAERGIRAAVVSLPCWELFEQQTASYRRAVLGGPRIGKVAVEAALGFGWERHIGAKGAFIGMTGFGASAPAADLYRHFGITAEAVAAAAAELV